MNDDFINACLYLNFDRLKTKHLRTKTNLNLTTRFGFCRKPILVRLNLHPAAPHNMHIAHKLRLKVDVRLEKRQFFSSKKLSNCAFN